MQRYGQHVATIELTPIGQQKRDWQKVVVGDGWIVVRHPDFATATQMSERFVNDLLIVAS